ncbi:hypothetical protein [Pseudarthrobacter oxydans]|uniref:hypothetical protein n=1 Tax=Pseudarthrobacter oxydans TaxID=1671 RepID=UPI00344C2478
MKLVEETINSLGNRLNKLSSLASKGVHQEFTLIEAESCLMWTFFLTADFLRIEDGSSGLLSGGKAHPSSGRKCSFAGTQAPPATGTCELPSAPDVSTRCY